jgi:carboxypeptidase-like protein
MTRRYGYPAGPWTVRQTALSVATLTCVCAGVVAAQAELQGRVLADGTRRPLSNALVYLPKLDLRALSDSLGRYRVEKIPRGEHLVITRALGFHVDSAMTAFDGDETIVNDVVLKVALNELPTVAVKEAGPPATRGKMVDYDRRKALGIGHFLDRALFEKNDGRQVSEILASHSPGLTIYRGGQSTAWAATGRNKSSAKCSFCAVSKGEMLDGWDIALGAPLACYADVYLDGAAVYSSSARKAPLFNLNSITASEIEAIEVYSSAAQVPAQYNKTSGGCGVLLIWTRTGTR